MKVRQSSLVYADLDFPGVKPVTELFASLRPDIAIIYEGNIETFELTVCLETNFIKSKLYKQSKYQSSLKGDIRPEFKNLKLINETVEISNLGLYADMPGPKLNFLFNIIVFTVVA